MNHKATIYIWLIILTIISVIALCRSFYNDIMLGVDYSGILVGILAALCTVLIGWQIYTLIDLNQREQKNKERIDNLKKVVKGVHENGNRGDYLLYDNLSELYENILSDNIEQYKYERIHFKLNAVIYASKIGEYETCELGIELITIFLIKHKVVLNYEQKERLLKIACSTSNQNRIKNFTKLIEALSKIIVTG